MPEATVMRPPSRFTSGLIAQKGTMRCSFRAEAIETFTPTEYENYFGAADYDQD